MNDAPEYVLLYVALGTIAWLGFGIAVLVIL